MKKSYLFSFKLTRRGETKLQLKWAKWTNFLLFLKFDYRSRQLHAQKHDWKWVNATLRIHIILIVQ